MEVESDYGEMYGDYGFYDYLYSNILRGSLGKQLYDMVLAAAQLVEVRVSDISVDKVRHCRKDQGQWLSFSIPFSKRGNSKIHLDLHKRKYQQNFWVKFFAWEAGRAPAGEELGDGQFRQKFTNLFKKIGTSSFRWETFVERNQIPVFNKSAHALYDLFYNFSRFDLEEWSMENCT